MVVLGRLQQLKKPWKKGLVVSDKMDKSVSVMVGRWAQAWYAIGSFLALLLRFPFSIVFIYLALFTLQMHHGSQEW